MHKSVGLDNLLLSAQVGKSFIVLWKSGSDSARGDGQPGFIKVSVRVSNRFQLDSYRWIVTLETTRRHTEAGMP